MMGVCYSKRGQAPEYMFSFPHGIGVEISERLIIRQVPYFFHLINDITHRVVQSRGDIVYCVYTSIDSTYQNHSE